MAAVALDDQDAKQPVAVPTCPTCGEPLRYKGQKGTEVASRIGEIDLERGHYYCARCHSGLFPLDQQLELVDGHWSCGVAQDAVWLSGLVSSYEAAQVVLARLSRINLATTSVWRQAQVWGAKFSAV